jgi:hypothetical protein
MPLPVLVPTGEVTHSFNIDFDSSEYEMLYEAAVAVKGIDGISCEVGLRRGGGSAYIMQGLSDSGQFDRLHIALDPYGNIEMSANDQVAFRFDYTNEMRDQCIIDMLLLSKKTKIPFQLFPLEDTEFFNRFADGIPVYDQYKKLINQYALVHFDGPHALSPIRREFLWFNARAPIGAVFVFDDTTFYDHESLEKEFVIPAGWTVLNRGNRKISYKRTY